MNFLRIIWSENSDEEGKILLITEQQYYVLEQEDIVEMFMEAKEVIMNTLPLLKQRGYRSIIAEN